MRHTKILKIGVILWILWGIIPVFAEVITIQRREIQNEIFDLETPAVPRSAEVIYYDMDTPEVPKKKEKKPPTAKTFGQLSTEKRPSDPPKNKENLELRDSPVLKDTPTANPLRPFKSL